ncbi:MAG: glutamate 5-kinase, partial [Armatimonadetes bacterium]|nr:glutamate 5-kinase [Armatimonadota bacterium]
MSDNTGLAQLRRIVVKVGTRLVTRPDGTADHGFMSALAAQIARLRERGIETILVTSGAVNLGRGLMFPDVRRALRVSERPAAAAAGQPLLMREWAKAFDKVNLRIAQVLLTQDDVVDRERCVHLRGTMEALLANDIVPVLNENDSVSGPETTFGENDNLAAMVAVALVSADLLVFLQDEEGLLTADPRKNDNAELISCVGPDEDLSAYAEDAGGPESLGGMKRKIEAARRATDCGIRVVIARGTADDALLRIADGEDLGTCLLPRARIPSRKGWLTVHGRPAGSIMVDDGARRALLHHDGASLLPSGIVATSGDFRAGDLVTIKDQQGHVIARGLTNYSSDEIEVIRGKHSSRISQLLGRDGGEEVVHRDDMVLM